MKTTLRRQWWVVTDLDGTLMDHRYDCAPALGTIRLLQRRGIPIIPCTSKTAEEVRRFREQTGLRDPFIVENGGAIHGENADGSPWQQTLGPSWQELRPQLDGLAHDLGQPLQALDDLSDQDADRLLGLGGDALRQAQRRACSVPFVPPPDGESRRRLQQLAQARQLAVVQGNRLGHLLGADVSKGRALAVLKQRQGASEVAVLALGDSPNDLPLLHAGDRSIVVPGVDGPHPALQAGLEDGRFQLAPAPHGHGWASAVEHWLQGLQDGSPDDCAAHRE